MGTIQNKRASGRQAPPQVYAPFFGAQSGEAAKEAGIAYLVIIAIFMAVGIVFIVLRFAGFDVDSWLE